MDLRAQQNVLKSLLILGAPDLRGLYAAGEGLQEWKKHGNKEPALMESKSVVRILSMTSSIHASYMCLSNALLVCIKPEQIQYCF